MPVGTPAGSAGGTWWVIPEGTVGLSIGELSRIFATGSVSAPGLAGVGSIFTVTQSNTRPRNALAGPFATQAIAQMQATAANTRISGNTTPTVAGVGKGLIGDIVGNFDLGHILLYVGEFILGVVLIGVGLAKITGTDNVINKAAKAAGAVAFL